MAVKPEDVTEAIETLEHLLDCECLVVGEMERNGEEDIDRRPMRAFCTALNILKQHKENS